MRTVFSHSMLVALFAACASSAYAQTPFRSALEKIVDASPTFESLRDKKVPAQKNDLGETEYESRTNAWGRL